ncbi:FkbM family methyltransferase [Roseobacteraceae bacterium S113]
MPIDFPHMIRANEYGFYCIPESYQGRDIVDIIVDGGVYEPATLRFLRRQVGTGSVVTGGTFIGDFLPALHEMLSSKAKIICFEPVPMNHECCLETIKLNGLTKVQLHNVAVSETEGEMTMMVTRPSGKPIAAGERIVEDQEADGERYIAIPTKPIDTLVPAKTKVSILHLDIEGHEEQGLRGATRVLNESKPLVILEAGKDWRARGFLTLLQELAPDAGYRLVGKMEKNAIFRALGSE